MSHALLIDSKYFKGTRRGILVLFFLLHNYFQMLMSVEDIINRTIDEASQDLRQLSLKLHDNPELAMKEFKACQLLCQYLKSKGYQVDRNVAGLETAFMATYISSVGAQGGLQVGFCSEYDALPGIGHACGHNLIAISGVAMFLAISQVLEQCKIPGIVKLYGTPAEEAIGGKIIMLDRGIFDGSDLLMMLHPTAGFSGKWHAQSCLTMEIEYFGKAAHAAGNPWDGINAGSAATIAMQTLGVLREQMKPNWRAHGIIKTGGQAANVIPEHSKIEYTIRTEFAYELEELRQRVLNVFESAALATGCTHKVKEEFAYLDNLDNPALGEMYEQIMQDKYQKPPMRGMGGSTDFGNLSQRFISLHGMFDTGAPSHPLNHTVEFTKSVRTETAHEYTIFASKTTARVAARCLVDSGFWQKVKSNNI